MLITEVLAQPETGQPEWVEVFNPDDTAQNLSGFVLKDQLAAPSVLYTFGEQSVGPGQYFMVELSGSKLNNAGDGVQLYTASGSLLDTMTFSSSQKGLSWQKYAHGWCEAAPTPAGPHSCPEPTPTPSPTPSATPQPTTSPLPSASASPSPPTQVSSTQTAVMPSQSPTPQPSSSPSADSQQAEISAQLASLEKLFTLPVAWNIRWAEREPETTPEPTPMPTPPTSEALYIQSPQAGRLFPSRLVIMGGLLAVSSIFVPAYDQIKSHLARLGQRFVPTRGLGIVHLRAKRSIGPPQPG